MGDAEISSIRGRAESLRHQIYQDLRDKLRSGEIGPDDRLVDVNIAKSLGVSRMPVREALLQLISEGYLVGTTRGFVLPETTLEDIAHIFEVRKLIEPRAAGNAARDIGESGVAILRQSLDRTRKAVEAGDVEELKAANVTFRETWLAAVRNRRLAETISRFADQAQIVRLGTLSDPPTQLVVRDGMAGLYDAFSRGDVMAAQDRMASFIADAEKSYFLIQRERAREAAGDAHDRLES